ncbi:hypothetical protein [Gluconobacter thailandicus]|nr:hypothetical protein [Gluconobacter thailandicus]
MTRVGKMLTAGERDKSFPKNNNIYAFLGGGKKDARSRSTYRRAGVKAERSLLEKLFKNPVSPEARRPVKPTAGSVSSVVNGRNTPIFRKTFKHLSDVWRPGKHEAKGAARASAIGVVRSIISHQHGKIISGFQENNLIRLKTQGSNSVQNVNGKLPNSVVPSGVERKKISENLMQDQNGQHQMVKEDSFFDAVGRASSKSRVGIFERHDLERSLRLATRQGHGGVDELRFPQYPGRSIGMS